MIDSTPRMYFSDHSGETYFDSHEPEPSKVLKTFDLLSNIINSKIYLYRRNIMFVAPVAGQNQAKPSQGCSPLL